MSHHLEQMLTPPSQSLKHPLSIHGITDTRDTYGYACVTHYPPWASMCAAQSGSAFGGARCTGLGI